MNNIQKIINQIDAQIFVYKLEMNTRYGILNQINVISHYDKIHDLKTKRNRILKLNKIKELCQQQDKM